MRVATFVDRPLLRVTNGRLRLSFVIPCLLLRCRGARSGRLREVPLLYVLDGKDYLVMGSGGGSTREPAWCANLRSDPLVETVCKGVVERRRAVELSGMARVSGWQLAVAAYPGYGSYQTRLARAIPLFGLRPIE